MIIGIDMGGTHTDGVIVDKEKILKTAKRTTDRKNLLTTIWSTLQELLEGRDKEKISSINLSTTVSTNAIVENKASRVGMIVQSGPGLNHDFSSV
ncbi:MAG TPA: hydantoinase/oxoprolinase N-terminal domain-containing protein, partial [Halomonas sp.]|nr:hydantoinase/oxoprolinase N-terminal domain-containing protein [Halomonas sp.]